jgi:hypothetical protein
MRFPARFRIPQGPALAKTAGMTMSMPVIAEEKQDKRGKP